MAKNQIPDSIDPLVALAEDAADGAQTHQVAVGLKQNLAANIRADLQALIGDPALGAKGKQGERGFEIHACSQAFFAPL